MELILPILSLFCALETGYIDARFLTGLLCSNASYCISGIENLCICYDYWFILSIYCYKFWSWSIFTRCFIVKTSWLSLSKLCLITSNSPLILFSWAIISTLLRSKQSSIFDSICCWSGTHFARSAATYYYLVSFSWYIFFIWISSSSIYRSNLPKSTISGWDNSLIIYSSFVN